MQVPYIGCHNLEGHATLWRQYHVFTDHSDNRSQFFTSSWEGSIMAVLIVPDMHLETSI